MARQTAVALLENAGTTTGSAVGWDGGILGITASGTVLDVQIQLLDRNDTWVPIAALAHTAAGYLVEVVPAGKIRAVDVGGTAVYVYAMRIDT